MKKCSKKMVIKGLIIIIQLFFILSIIVNTNYIYQINGKYKTSLKAQTENDSGIHTDKEWLNEDFWEWHTRTTTTDQAYNGNHIVLGEDILFYGYGVNSYKDFLFKEYSYAGKKNFAFTIDETLADYHTLDGAGFIFNAEKENEKISGYVLLYRKSDIVLYKLDNIDVNTFETASNASIATYGTVIKSVNKPSGTIHNLIINTSPTNVTIIDNEVEILNVNLDYTKHVGESFGLISSYLQHNCSRLSTIQFKYFNLVLEDYKIPVLKTDTDSNPLQGAKFQVENENGEIVREGVSTEDGIYIIEGLPEGIYTVEEIEAPRTYALNNKVYKFKVTNEGKAIDINTDEEIELKFENELLKVEIINKEIDTENPIQNSKITLYNKDGKEITVITDKEGIGTFKGIEPGTYTYKQTYVSDEYILDDNKYTFKIDKYGNVEFIDDEGEIYNKKKPVENNDKDNNEVDKNEEKEELPSFLPQTGTKIFYIGIIVFIIIGTLIFYGIGLYKMKE